ncbi:MAG: hypothetical protein methR_P0202 [Methyloprofundus sp.]|nr:MAG: hypothetical protein methR_P0202 [Methyloprofundus sp.]
MLLNKLNPIKQCCYLITISSPILLLLIACSNNESRAQQSPPNKVLSTSNMANTAINQGLVALLTLPGQATLGSPLNIHFELKNNRSTPITLLKWGTPLEGKFTRNIFQISKQGQTIDYLGRNIKRSAPTDADFITLQPYSSIKATIDLQQGYEIQTTGRYKISLNLHHLQNKQNNLEPVNTGMPIYVDIQ